MVDVKKGRLTVASSLPSSSVSITVEDTDLRAYGEGDLDRLIRGIELGRSSETTPLEQRSISFRVADD